MLINSQSSNFAMRIISSAKGRRGVFILKYPPSIDFVKYVRMIRFCTILKKMGYKSVGRTAESDLQFGGIRKNVLKLMMMTMRMTMTFMFMMMVQCG